LLFGVTTDTLDGVAMPAPAGLALALVEPPPPQADKTAARAALRTKTNK
jgi:hypothetical protein